MDKELVARPEAIVVSGSRALPAGHTGDEPAAVDPAIAAFDELLVNSLGRLSAAADKIGGPVQDVTKILAEAFAVLKELLIKAKQCQKPDLAGLQEFLKALDEVILRANALADRGRRSEFFNHLKAAAYSLTALAWIAYMGKDCATSMQISHVEESWQRAGFYNNKVLMEYRTKHANHIEWAKALKELYLPGLRDYVKSFFPLGIVWASAGVAVVAAPPPSHRPAGIKKRLPAVFQGISFTESLASDPPVRDVVRYTYTTPSFVHRPSPPLKTRQCSAFGDFGEISSAESTSLVLSHPDVQIDVSDEIGRNSEISNGWDILKSIVYGGLTESITSLAVVSSAAGAGASTLSVIGLGLANLVGGLLSIIHDLFELRAAQDEAIEQRDQRVGRYWELLGQRENFRLHFIVAVISYILLGLMPPVVYGFSFRKSGDKEYKLIAVTAASFLCIALLAIGKAHVKPPTAYIKTLFYYLSLGISSSAISCVTGVLINRLLDHLGWFHQSTALSSPPALFPREASLRGSAWASY